MILRDFMYMYDNWNGIVCINDDNLNLINEGRTSVALSYRDTYGREVVAFGFYDNELCVRVK